MQSPCRPERLRLEPIFVGFAGRMGAGKTAAARFLGSRYGFQYTRYSRVLRDLVGVRKRDRRSLQEAGSELMVGGRQQELNERLISSLDHSKSTAIDGLRHPVDHACLRSAFGGSFRLIFVQAAEQMRFERLRNKFTSREAFQAADLSPVESHIDCLMPLSDIVIRNEQTIELLCQQLEGWLSACWYREQI